MFNLAQYLDLRYSTHQRVHADIQGNLLKGHGRKYSAAVFVRLPSDAGDARRWFARLLADLPISAAEQRDDKIAWNSLGRGRNETPFRTIALAWAGYEHLGLSQFAPEDNAEDPTSFDAFRKGLKAEASGYISWRSDSEKWEARFQCDYHLVVLLANDSKNRLRREAESLREGAEEWPGLRVELEYGRRSAHEPKPDDDANLVREHFGFVDGVAKTKFFSDEVPATPPGGWLHRGPGRHLDTILRPEKAIPGVDPDIGSFGSFVTFFKFEQNVRLFREQSAELARALELDDGEAAQSICVGRNKSGAPLVEEAGGRPTAPHDDFHYRLPEVEKAYSARAHIRSMNARKERRELFILRRSMYYGKPWRDDGVAENSPSGGVGLLFIGFASSPHIFPTLMMGTQFPPCVDDGGAGQGGVDGLVGQRTADSPCDGRQLWRSSSTQREAVFPMQDFVKPLGGECFFVPSISFFRHAREALRTDEAPRKSGKR